MKFVQTAERISQVEESDHVIFQRSLFAYHEASKLVGNTMLEVGTGMGYGLEILAPCVTSYIAIDKYSSPLIEQNKDNPDFSFHQMKVPPFSNLQNEWVDHVVTFQVIEHINKDELFIKEIHRILKIGGSLILTTPNIRMSLTRNPWHVREYTVMQLKQLLSGYFKEVNILGVYGNEKVLRYYEENKHSVQQFTRFDVLNLQYWLPRKVLQIPYDLLNRINRRKLLKMSRDETKDISIQDFYLKEADDNCFDLFAIAVK